MINKIYHISDIHIKLYRRKKQYINVLENLIEYINETKDQNSLIVITGDIVHSKTQLSPQAVQLVDTYFNKLSKILPTIVIAGNHDANLSNQHRLDALTPIVSLINKYNSNLHYYRDTGWYIYQNLNIWVNSVFDQKLPISMKDQGINICLYHGCLSNVTANGVNLSGRFKASDFSMFDYVLLGDIHKHQILSYDPITAYAGSLVQLNFGQQIDTHGILVWKLDQNTVQHIQIHNDYAYYNITVQNGQIINLPKINAKHPRIKLKYRQTNSAQLKQIQQKLKSLYQVDQIMLHKVSQQLQVRGSDFIYNLQDINDTQYQEKILSQYIQHIKYNISEKDLLKIFQINSELNSIYKSKRLANSQNIWSIQRLQFSNFFSYGEDNVVQFEQYNGVIGIVGQNRAGKTSLISTLMFMLYDKCDATNRSLSVLNNQKNNLYGKVNLLINEKPYVIQRYGEVDKRRQNLPIKVKFYTYDQQGNVVDLSGTQRLSTNQIIQSYIGTYQDACATFFSTQGKSNTFIQMTNTSRKGQLNSLLNLTIFQNCATQAGQRSKYLKGYLNGVDATNLEKEVEQSKKNILQTKLLVKQMDSEISRFQLELSEKQDKLKFLLQKKQSQSEEIIDINYVQNQINDIVNNQNSLKKTKENSKLKIEETQNSLLQIKQLLSSCNLQKLLKRKQNLQSYKQQYDKLSLQKEKLLIYLHQNNKKSKMLQNLQYDQNCQYCVKNPLTKDAINSKQQIKRITSDLNITDERLKQLYPNISQLENLNKDIKLIQSQIVPLKTKLIQQLSELTQKLSQVENKIFKSNSKLQKLYIIKEQYYTNKKAIQDNIIIDNQISNLNKQIIKLKQMLKKLENEIISYKIKLSNSNQIIKNNEKSLKLYEQKNYEYSLLQKYKSLIGRNGLQYYITSNIISILQTQINRVLQMLANFTVQFVMQGKSIDINIVYPNKKYQIQTCSGFQKFLMSIAIRHTLSSITNKSKGKIFVIDQGFGVLDSQNVSSFNKILEFIAQRYQTLLIVSHLQVMRSMFLKSIAIEYKSGESKIR